MAIIYFVYEIAIILNVPAPYSLYAVTLPAAYSLFAGTVPSFNLFLILIAYLRMFECKQCGTEASDWQTSETMLEQHTTDGADWAWHMNN